MSNVQQTSHRKTAAESNYGNVALLREPLRNTTSLQLNQLFVLQHFQKTLNIVHHCLPKS